MTKITWKWTNYLGGEADNPRTGPDGAVNKLEGLDVRTSPKEVKLSKVLTDTGWTFTSDIILLEDIEHLGGSGVVTACDDGTIYLNGTTKATLNHTGSVAAYNRIVGIASMKVGATQYLYYFSETSFGTGAIWKSTMDLTNFVEVDTFTTASSDDGVQTLSEAGRIVFAVSNKVFEIDAVGEVVTEKLEFADFENTIGLTVYQNKYRVYTNANDEDARIYYWDGVANDYDDVIIWENLSIKDVANDTGYDYIIAGNGITSDLYMLAGTQKQEVRINTGSVGRQFSGFISINQGIIYISGNGKDGQDGIYTYGNFFPGYPKSLALEYPVATSFMEFHTHNKNGSYFSSGDDKVYKILVESGNLNATGTMESLIFDGGEGHAFVKKSINYAYVGFGNTNATDYIQIYAKSDGGAYKLLKTLNDNHTGLRGVRIDRTEFQSVGLGDFFDLQYKVVLNSDGVSSLYFRGIETYITSGIDK